MIEFGSDWSLPRKEQAFLFEVVVSTNETSTVW
jgi:hypothetical protein